MYLVIDSIRLNLKNPIHVLFSYNLKRCVAMLANNFMMNIRNNVSRLDVWHAWSFKEATIH